MKKSICTLLAVLASLCLFGACTTTPSETPNPDNGTIETPDNGGNEGGEVGGDENQGGNENEGGETEKDEVLVLLESAYGLEKGATLAGTHTLTGVVTNVAKTGEGEACLTIVANGYEAYPMYCYWLKGDYAGNLKVGDTITVSGTIKNYNGTIEFDKPTLVSYEQAGGGNEGYAYTAFTVAEEALLVQYIGEVIPFLPTNEYSLNSFYDNGDYSEGFYYYTVGNTQAEFEAYKTMLTEANFTESGSQEDEYGDTWYYFDKGDLCVDVAYYEYEGNYYVDVYAYISTEEDGPVGGDDVEADGITHLNNHGKGLPSSANGVYEVDFTKGQYVKNVTDQGYYDGGCPTVGEAGVLVIPVEFNDVTAESKGYTIQKLKTAWMGASGTDYYSVYDYYYESSHGKLDLQITVLDSWFKPAYNMAYYRDSFDANGMNNGDQLIMHEALSYLAGKRDLTKYDCDGNGIIDSVVLIPTVDIDYTGKQIFQWAYRYWNSTLNPSTDNYYLFDGVRANDYLWAPYQFMHEGFPGDRGEGDRGVFDSSFCNTYAFIHEFGHVLGCEDYYDTSYSYNSSLLSGYDVMASIAGDHNAYSKFNYGWVTTSRLVVAEESVTLTLEAFHKNGDSIIIANNWDETLGAYQEYYVLVYYKNVGLNSGNGGYFNDEGILVYHVNASLCKEVLDGVTYYDVYNNNTDISDEDGYGTEDNLIEFVKSASRKFVYGVGDSMPTTVKDDSNNSLLYNFRVDAITADTATITFTKQK